MKVYQTNEIKNIALIGSAGSGKTTLAESMLFEAGIIKRRGSVEAKNTVSDYFPVEQEYGYSVFPTVFHAEWNGKKLNIIDCPGSDDFVGGAITALNVTDQAVILINGQYGPEVGTQNNFRYTEKLHKPVIFLVNQLDSDKCDFDQLIQSMKDIYGPKCVQIQYPVQTGPDFHEIIDVLIMKKLSWGPDGGAPKREEIPAEEMEKAMELHKALVEAAAENDEALMEKFFEEETLTEDEMREGIRKGLVMRNIFPVFCVDAHKDMGVQRLMEFLGNVVPFVSEMPKVHNTRGEEVTPDSNGPESIYFFKTGMEPHIGEVSYFKVMSGSIKSGDDLTNADRGSKERIGQIFACAGANRIPVDQRGRPGLHRETEGCQDGQHAQRQGYGGAFRLHQISQLQVFTRHQGRQRERYGEDDGSPAQDAPGGPDMGGGAEQGTGPDDRSRTGRVPPAHAEMAYGEQRETRREV